MLTELITPDKAGVSEGQAQFAVTAFAPLFPRGYASSWHHLAHSRVLCARHVIEPPRSQAANIRRSGRMAPRLNVTVCD